MHVLFVYIHVLINKQFINIILNKTMEFHLTFKIHFPSPFPQQQIKKYMKQNIKFNATILFVQLQVSR